MNHQDWKAIILKDKKEPVFKDIIPKPVHKQNNVKEDIINDYLSNFVEATS
jgi:hypothetical protein